LENKLYLSLVGSKVPIMAIGVKPSLKIILYSKYLGFCLVMSGIPTMMLDNSSGAEMPLLVGLFTLVVTTNKIEDERSAQLKTSSLYIAFMISYAVKLILTNLHDHALVSFELTEINHFLILTLAVANSIFYGRLYILKF
jgi:hypothetical protein